MVSMLETGKEAEKTDSDEERRNKEYGVFQIENMFLLLPWWRLWPLPQRQLLRTDAEKQTHQQLAGLSTCPVFSQQGPH